MSLERTSESEHLFNDDKGNDNVSLDDINENNTACISEAQKQPTMKELLIKRFPLSIPLTSEDRYNRACKIEREKYGMNVVILFCIKNLMIRVARFPE